MTIYVFDMDGTLTPPRLPMTNDFAAWFLSWQQTHSSFIATGSDFKKVHEQLCNDVINAFTGVYCSMGNVLMKGETLVYQKDFVEPKGLTEMLEGFRKNTDYPGERFPNYIERRIGMVNFSVLGRNCPYEERNRYGAWDKENGERFKLRDILAKAYPQLEISVGGSISIDIVPKGCGKGQIAHHLRKTFPNEKIVFFGDRTLPGGNDYELACELGQYDNTETVQVEGPAFVMEYLKKNS